MKKSAILMTVMALGVTGSAFAAEINDQLEINGEVRYSYLSQKASVNDGYGYEALLRTRLELAYKPMENLKLVVMGENQHAFRQEDKKNRGSFHHDINLRRAYLEGKLGKADITVGRVGVALADGEVLDDDLDRVDSLQVGYDINDKVKIEGFAAQTIDGHEDEYNNKRKKMYGARVTYAPVEPLEVKAEYAAFRNYSYEDGAGDQYKVKNDIFALSASYEAMKDLTASAAYMHGKPSGHEEVKSLDKNGYVLGLAYRGAEAAERGSWGVNVKYYNQGVASFIAHAGDGNFDFDNGVKGWFVGADYAVAKNVVAELGYYDTKDKKNSSEKDRRIWSAVTWSF